MSRLYSLRETGRPPGVKKKGFHLSLPVTLGVILLLWFGYTLFPGSNPPPELRGTWEAILGTLPGVLGVSLLLLTGFTLTDCYLRPALISKQGLAVLAGITLLLIPILLTGSWAGPNWLVLLVLAPLSGITQELFFRGTLLPVLLKSFGNRLWMALGIQAVLFTLWHLRTFLAVAEPLVSLPMVFVFLMGGVGWGWQAHHDRTVIWTMGQHALMLMVMSFFGFGSA